MIQDGVFAGQVGVITGGGSGIGRAIALEFAAYGGTPCLVGRDAGKLREVAQQVRPSAPGVSIRQCDLSKSDEVASLAASIEELGRVDLLVHSAGAWEAAPLDETSSEMLDRLYAINVRAPLELTRRLLVRLETAQGQVVFVSSSAALRASPELVAYGATKRAMTGVADHVRQEVNSRGVRVLSVYPGRTATPMQERVFRHEAQTYDAARLLQPEDVATIVLQSVALPRTAEVTDIHIRPMRSMR
jgi:NAD(P)-dependent dehydrogenase (short-subunit alcohol dehydrogenase family)